MENKLPKCKTCDRILFISDRSKRKTCRVCDFKRDRADGLKRLKKNLPEVYEDLINQRLITIHD